MPFVQILSIILKIKKIRSALVLFHCWETGKFKPHKPYDKDNNRKCAFWIRNEDTLLATQANFESLVHELIKFFF